MSLPAEVAGLVRPDGTVLVPARVAERMLRVLVLGLSDDRRRNAGGRLDPEFVKVLHALQAAASREDSRLSSDVGTMDGESVSVALGRCTASQAAALLECTTRWVTKACVEGRLPGQKVGSIWLIEREAVEAYRHRRSA